MAFQELLQAATTISNTEIGEEDISYLLDHRTEFENAFAKLHALLGSSSAVIRSVSAASPAGERPVAPACPSSPTTEQRPSVGETLPHDISERSQPIPTPQHTTVDMEAVPDSVRELIRLLERRKRPISNFTYRSEAKLDICPGNVAEDPRVTIIKFVSQKRTQAHYYLAGLAALSLAEDFLLWQRADGRPTRLDILFDDIDSLGGEGYRDYADSCPIFMDKDSAAQYTRFGVKLLFFEQLCLVRYKVSITCAASSSDSDALFPISVSEDPSSPNNTPDPVGSGASLRRHAVIYPLFFVWRAFYRCKYGDLPALANALLSLQFWREWTEKKDWHELNPLFPGITPPLGYAAHNDKRKRTPTVQSSKKKRKRHRTGQSTPQPSERSSIRGILPDGPRIFPDQVPDAPRDIWPLGSPVFRDLQQDTQARNVWPLGSPLFRDPQQDAPARNVWPLGSPVFPDQPQDITGRNIYPVGSMVFPENVQSISTSDPLTPCGFHLSTSDLASEVANVIRNLATATGNQTGIANEA